MRSFLRYLLFLSAALLLVCGLGAARGWVEIPVSALWYLSIKNNSILSSAQTAGGGHSLSRYPSPRPPTAPAPPLFSFLPEIVRLCRENGIQLIVVRGKTISFAHIPKPAGLDGYIRDLEDYLNKNGARFADLEPDARLGARDYIDRFHVQPEARGIYTQMLAEALIPLLPK